MIVLAVLGTRKAMLLEVNAQLLMFCRMVLKYLIPVKLSLGTLPKYSLLQRYNLLEVYLRS
jgi:hypothetical protein